METWVIGNNSVDEVLAYITQLFGDSLGDAIVCLDYFDTLVTRSIVPERTKVIASHLLAKGLNSRVAGDRIYSMRRDLELEMTTTNGERRGELDFRLDEFAQAFYSKLVEESAFSRTCSKEDFTSLLLNIELAVEKAVQHVCPEMLRLISLLQNTGVKILLLSDFYLPAEQFKKMLQHKGLSSYFQDVYVSSSIGKGKGSGRMYEQVCSDHHCYPQNMLMIGDNLHADIHMARENGLQTLHVQRQAQTGQSQNWQQDQANKEPSNPARLFETVKYPEVPFKEMGSSLWLFIHKLFDELIQNDVKNIFFLSKEGEFLRTLFVAYQEMLFGKERIASHYLIASRKSTFIASLKPLPGEDFSRLLNHYRDLSIREFVQSLNFQEDDVESVIADLGFDCEERLPQLVAHPHFKILLESDLFKEVYEQRRSLQSDAFKKYIEQFDCDVEGEGIHIVDVGWKGSIQDNIYHIFGGKCSVDGYYIGSLNPTEVNEKNRKIGLLFSNTPIESPYLAVYNNNRSLFEMLLGASHGSADCYTISRRSEGHNSISRIHSTYPIGEEDLEVSVQEHPDERKLFVEVVQPLQDAYLNYFKQLTIRYIEVEAVGIGPKWFAQKHARMVFLPENRELELFESMYHLENFGIFEFAKFNSEGQFSFFQRLKNLKNIVTDPPILESGVWPPVILRRFGVGFWQRIDGLQRYFRVFGLSGK